MNPVSKSTQVLQERSLAPLNIIIHSACNLFEARLCEKNQSSIVSRRSEVVSLFSLSGRAADGVLRPRQLKVPLEVGVALLGLHRLQLGITELRLEVGVGLTEKNA